MLDQDLVAEILLLAQAGGAEFSELFVEDRFTNRLTMNNNQIKDANGGNDFGAGIRVVYGTKVVYAYTNDLTREGLSQIAESVARASGFEGELIHSKLMDFRIFSPQKLYTVTHHPREHKHIERIDMMRRAGAAAQTGFVKTVEVSYLDWVQNVLIANSDGLWVEDQRFHSRLGVTAIAQDVSYRASGFCFPGKSMGLEAFVGTIPEQAGIEAARKANAMLHADFAPAGKFPVVVGHGGGGFLFHEACGHILETTAIEKNASVFADKIGQRIAHESVTAIDDGTIAGGLGSTNIDDEGMETQRTVLIEKGILRSYMVDKVGEMKTGYACTGSGRRQDYTFAPASRMRNTFIAAGEDTPENLIKQVKLGLYARSIGGGSVTPGTGDYNFSVTEGYIIRDGQVCEPVRDATLVGNGVTDLQNVVAVANDLVRSPGFCGSVSGTIAVEVGQPHVLISEMTVGGRG
jgi:TldD protein